MVGPDILTKVAGALLLCLSAFGRQATNSVKLIKIERNTFIRVSDLVSFAILRKKEVIMKYRLLDKEELVEMEEEFIRFLATRSIPGPDWEKMKTTQPERVNGLLEEFSDLVFEKILAGVAFLEMKLRDDVKVFRCEKDKIALIGMSVEGAKDIDFTANQSPGDMMAQFKNSGAQLKLYQAEKPYKGNREKELFAMLEAGCVISNGELFSTLEGLRNVKS